MSLQHSPNINENLSQMKLVLHRFAASATNILRMLQRRRAVFADSVVDKLA